MTPLQHSDWFADEGEFPVLSNQAEWQLIPKTEADHDGHNLDDYLVITYHDKQDQSDPHDDEMERLRVTPLEKADPPVVSYADILKRGPTAPIKNSPSKIVIRRYPGAAARSPIKIKLANHYVDIDDLDHAAIRKSQNRYHHQRLHFSYRPLAERLCRIGLGDLTRETSILQTDDLQVYTNEMAHPRTVYKSWAYLYSAPWELPYKKRNEDCRSLMELTS
ncbi:hypothetical protein DM01DRAFT_1332724 [Hesseltinella vesiculosa]|uniref:Uncharacterized protein n=1 Tax=Hesseltinella vesiculosa TaxID=101127 RepID=A0A1X2GSW3_9FUNG|nr:hypothetical protein DM01DRAFT_1332724 [Hesseltinella vesiculosa]